MKQSGLCEQVRTDLREQLINSRKTSTHDLNTVAHLKSIVKSQPNREFADPKIGDGRAITQYVDEPRVF